MSKSSFHSANLHVFVAGALLSVGWACRTPSSTSSADTAPQPVANQITTDRQAAEQIALDYLRERGHLSIRYQVETRRRSDGLWSVFIEDLPLTPDAYRILLVDLKIQEVVEGHGGR